MQDAAQELQMLDRDPAATSYATQRISVCKLGYSHH